MRKLFTHYRASIFGIVTAASFFVVRVAFAACPNPNDLEILEPVPGSSLALSNCISADDIEDLGAFIKYVNGGIWNWAFGMGVAIAVLNGVIGGLTIVLSNGESSKIEAGKTRFMWSTIGLIVLLLSGVILQFINPKGFRNF